MPKTKRVRKNMTRKRTFRPKRKQALSAINTLGPLPARYVTKQKYSDIFTLSSANANQYQYNLNSVWDPNRTSSSLGQHQPYGTDQLAALYSRYRVISCSYVITGIQPDVPGTNIRICAQPTNSVPNYANVSTMIESPRARFIVQGAQGSPLKTLKGKIYLPNLVGRTKAQYMSEDDYSAPVTANPNELAILHIMGGNMTDANVTISCQISLTFTVEYYDLIQLPRSF